MGHIEYTSKELEDEISDLNFLRDAFLVLLNEKVASKSDIYYTKDEVMKYAKEMYLDLNYSKEFIEECFKPNKS